MMSLQYPIVIVPAEEGGYFVSCPVLPGCFSQGETPEEARSNIREAIQLTVEDMLAEDEALPDLERVVATTVSVAIGAASHPVMAVPEAAPRRR